MDHIEFYISRHMPKNTRATVLNRGTGNTFRDVL
jgi:hypothetical protein